MLTWLFWLSCLQYKYVGLPNKVLSRYKRQKNGSRWLSPTPPEQSSVLRGLLVRFVWSLGSLQNKDVQK